MIRTRFKKVLLVAPDNFPDQLLTEYAYVKHIKARNNIFPSIHDLNPDLIIFDCDFMSKDVEKVLRRIKVNKFYQKIKIHCYKNKPNEQTDNLFKSLGVDEFIYSEGLPEIQKTKNKFNFLNSVVNIPLWNWANNAVN